MFQLSDYNYFLPKELIAQEPARPRDSSRLLVLKIKDQKIIHDSFLNFSRYLNNDDLLVINNSKVIPARLEARRETGAKLEVFLLQQKKDNLWQALIKGKVKEKELIIFDEKLKAKIYKTSDNKIKEIEFNIERSQLDKYLLKIGKVPLPPYIKKGQADKEDKKRYQTVFAQEPGSVAAPTAGLHFTKRTLKKLEKKEVEIANITLHVGLGTFLPITANDIRDHKIHSELVSISQKERDKIQKAKNDKKRIIAVGTTACRAIESLDNKQSNFYQFTDIYIYPNYKFKYTDGLLTNFHLPQSSLLVLVSALAGNELIKKAYQEAILKHYRFYSYGDAMLILP